MTTSSPLFCACGCGQEVPRRKYPSQQNRYINTHQHRGEHNGNYRGGDVSKACGVCGVTFSGPPSVISARATCASDACSREWQRLRAKASNANSRLVCRCAYCDKEVRKYRSQVSTLNFCNRYCQHAYHGKLVTADKNGRWKGGERQFMADQARIRDNNRCVICGFDLITEVHHITPRARGGTDDFSNLITLCPNHHRCADLGIINVEHLRNTAWVPEYIADTLTDSASH